MDLDEDSNFSSTITLTGALTVFVLKMCKKYTITTKISSAGGDTLSFSTPVIIDVLVKFSCRSQKITGYKGEVISN